MEERIVDRYGKVMQRKAQQKKYLMSKTYEIVTPESAEEGEVEDRGFEYEDMEFDNLYELIDEIINGGAIEASSSESYPRNWYLTEGSVTNYRTGERETNGFHPKDLTEEEAQLVFDSVKQRKNLAEEPEW